MFIFRYTKLTMFYLTLVEDTPKTLIYDKIDQKLKAIKFLNPIKI